MTALAAAHRRAGAYLGRHFRAIPECVREELAQQAILVWLQRRPSADVSAWVVGVARNEARHWWRDEGRPRITTPWEDLAEREGEAPRCPLDRLDGWQFVLAIAGAPPRHRTVLEHLYVRDGSVAELVATELLGRGQLASNPDHLDLARHVVYARHARAVDWLRRSVGVVLPARPRAAADIRANGDRLRREVASWFRARPAWHLARAARKELQIALKCSPNQITHAMVCLQSSLEIEARGDRGCREYRWGGSGTDLSTGLSDPGYVANRGPR